MVCEGLDTISKVYINKHFIGNTDNMFIRYKFNIKPFLRLGENSITISFESAVTYAQRAHDQYVRNRYIVPPGITCFEILFKGEKLIYLFIHSETAPLAQRGEPHFNYVRKMQSSFSWDWVWNCFDNNLDIELISVNNRRHPFRHKEFGRISE